MLLENGLKYVAVLQWTPGTKAGLMMLVDFLDNRLPAFAHDRAKIDRDSTSRLSPYIHFGEVSVRTPHPCLTAHASLFVQTH